MNDLWRTYADRIEALSLRERAMVLVASVVVIVFAIDVVFIEPVLSKKKALSAGIAQQQTELQALQTQIAGLEKNHAGAGAARLARRGELEHEIAALDDTLKQMNNGLVPAHNMRALLQEVLARSPRLQLVAMHTLPVTPLIEKRDKTDKPAAAPPASQDGQPRIVDSNVFKHGVQITVSGGYAELHDYLARLEKLPWRMLWSRASLNASGYPQLTLTVVIYTLSLDKAWLMV
jgi:MSHA biogenesis protein MshJ